jgi:hypothetical protein
MRRLIAVLCLYFLSLLLVYRFIHTPDNNPVSGATDARSAWIDVLSKCASTELLGSSVFYFGASNSVGPGSVWRKEGDGSLRLRFDLNELEPDVAKRAALIQEGNTADYSGQTGSKWLGEPTRMTLILRQHPTS